MNITKWHPLFYRMTEKKQLISHILFEENRSFSQLFAAFECQLYLSSDQRLQGIVKQTLLASNLQILISLKMSPNTF